MHKIWLNDVQALHSAIQILQEYLIAPKGMFFQFAELIKDKVPVVQLD
jgi:hypothetical protein